MDYINALVFLSLAITAECNSVKNENECAWMCRFLLRDYRQLQTDDNYTIESATEKLTKLCKWDMDYARYLNNHADKECPNFCSRFVKTILSDSALKFDASNNGKMMAWYTNAMFDYCSSYDYKGNT